MLIKLLSIFMFFVPLCESGGIGNTYSKTYTEKGTLKAEGWMMGTTKIKYWKFYHENGQLASEGHFKNNQKDGYWYFYNEKGALEKEGHYAQGIAENWWIFYDLANQQTLKIQHQNNQKHGYGLMYHRKKLIKAMKYVADQKMGEWKDLRSFRRDNPDVSLY